MTNFDSINDDCLKEIFQYLNISDVVNLSETCRRFADFADATVFPQWTIITIGNPFRPMYRAVQQLRILEHIGRHVTDLCCICVESTFLRSALALCPNVQRIRLEQIINLTPLQEFASVRLRALEITGDIGPHCFDDSWKNVFWKWPALEHITVEKNNKINGDVFTRFDRFKSIHIFNCHMLNVMEQLKVALCRNAESLQSLMIVGGSVRAHRIADLLEAVMAVTSFPRLEVMQIEWLHPFRIKCFRNRLPKLKRLDLVDRGINHYVLLSNISTHCGDTVQEVRILDGAIGSDTCSVFSKFEKLHSLRIVRPTRECARMMELIAGQAPHLQHFHACHCNSVTDDSVLVLVQCCVELKLLDVWHCRAVTFEAVRKLVRWLRKSEFEQFGGGDGGSALRHQLHFNVNTAFSNTKEKVYGLKILFI